MINLIPKEEKKRMIRDFYLRVVALSFIALSVSFLIAFVAILPSYFISSARVNIVNAKLEMQKNEPAPIPEERTLAVIKDLNNKLNLIEKARENEFVVSKKVIDAIFFRKMSEVKITGIVYENDPKNISSKGRKINIEGSAPSREVLLLFRQALEDDPVFKQVNLPISNFVKGSDIKFSLSLISS